MQVERGFISYFVNGIRYQSQFKGNAELPAGLSIEWTLQRELSGERLKITLNASNQTEIENVFLEGGNPVAPSDRIFLNGYQSWTISREFRPYEKIPGLVKVLKPLYRRFHLPHYGDYHLWNYSGKSGHLHSFTYSYVRRTTHSIDFVGSLTESFGFTIFEFLIKKKALRIAKDCSGLTIQGMYPVFDLYFSKGEDDRVFDEYFDRMKIAKPSVKPCTGWTSWYYYYIEITEKIILDNLTAFRERKVPIQIFQIDDGYQKSVGDWLEENEKFPSGMRRLSDEIHQAGYQAGLWLAPFICEAKSAIYLEQNDWLLKDLTGKPIPAGYSDGWSGPFYALDIYHPGFREYLRKVFQRVLKEWNFDMVKLDFLYAACILPRKDKTRGQVMSEAMDFLREVVGDKWILACGVPLGSAFGKVDYCRIGCDVALNWEERDPSIIHMRERVSTINAILDTIGRRHLSKRAFLNDPDVFILRHEKNSLNLDQRYTLFIINLLFGDLIFTSDNLRNYRDNFFGSETSAYLSQFPLTDKKIHSARDIQSSNLWKEKSWINQMIFGIQPYSNVYEIEFDIRGRRYIVLANLSSKSVRIPLPDGFYYENKTDTFYPGRDSIKMQPYASVCLLRIAENDPAQSDNILFAGTTGHIFPGSEIEELRIDGDEITVKSGSWFGNTLSVYFELPDRLDGIKVNGVYYSAYTEKGLKLVKAAI